MVPRRLPSVFLRSPMNRSNSSGSRKSPRYRSRSTTVPKLLFILLAVLLLLVLILHGVGVWITGNIYWFLPPPTHNDSPLVPTWWSPDPVTTPSSTNTIQGFPPGSFSYANAPLCSSQEQQQQKGESGQDKQQQQQQQEQRSCTIHFPQQIQLNSAGVVSALKCHAANYHHSNPFCLVTQRGQKQGPNQDRSLAITSNNNSKQNLLLAALLDGHGFDGEQVSQTAAIQLTSRILEVVRHNDQPPALTPENTDNRLVQALRQTFVEFDQHLLATTGFRGGSTALFLLVDSISTPSAAAHWISVGDSIGYLIQWSKDAAATRILHEVPAHKPADPEERKRIESWGGIVVDGQQGYSSRVQYQERIQAGTLRQQPAFATFTLAMSRSIGDRGGKVDPYSGAPRPLVIAEPYVATIPLPPSEQHVFAILASDGFMDMLLPEKQRIVQEIGDALYDMTSTTAGTTLDTTLERLVEEATQGWSKETEGTYRDDITVTVYKIQ